jgi:phosphoribosylaminoimidazole-succinocarboxamide synthase
MARRRQIYEGKAKILYEGPEPGTLIQYFKDDATAFNAQKKGTINGKGVINNRISEYVFTRLAPRPEQSRSAGALAFSHRRYCHVPPPPAL